MRKEKIPEHGEKEREKGGGNIKKIEREEKRKEG